MSAEDASCNDSGLHSEENAGRPVEDETLDGYDSLFDDPPGVPDGQGRSVEEAVADSRRRLDRPVFSREDVLDAAEDVVDANPDAEDGAYRLADQLLGSYTGSDGGSA